METISGGAADIARFGVFELNLRTGELRKAGVRIALQEQPLRVLVALIGRPGEIVSRVELCRELWPSGTFVDFEHSLNAAVRRLRLALGDDADFPRLIETVHKRGYRFIAFGDRYPHGRSSRWSAPGSSAPALPRLVRPLARLAVLPFEPSGGFADGLTDEAVTQLAQSAPREIGVLARASVEWARRAGGSAAEIGRALSANYLVDGTVRRDGDRVRITAQLIDSEEETHLWATTFDRVLADPLTLQTEVASEIARAVTGALTRGPQATS